ncbi:MAG TPA: peptidase [Saprospirales bacterium]|nr:peptidase [Saprospirales bacterium]
MANQQQLPPNIIKYGILAFLLIFIFSILSNTTFLTIQPGKKGVEFKRFGGGLDKDNIYDQGFHIIMPWNKVFIYDVRTNEGFETMDVLSKNGLNISVELSYRYSPMPDKIGYLHDEIGTEYVKRILMPEIRSATREVIGQYLPEELYSTKREAIEDEIYALTKINIEAKYLRLDAILIRDVTLPTTLRTAIEQKLKQEQESLEYEFKIDKARKEAERKEIEANGIAKFQKIVNRTITPQLLKWKGVEATQEIAKSQNAKVIVIGNGDGDLPIILGGN